MHKTCTKCGGEKSISEFGRDKLKRDGFRPICKACNREVAKLWEQKNATEIASKAKAWKSVNRTRLKASSQQWRHSETGQVSELLAAARKRAKQADLPFTLAAEDIQIPDLCPVLGKPLSKKTGKGPSPWSPSIDKVIPGKGYIPGNVMIMSHRANVMKNAATPTELLAFADWIYRTFGEPTATG